MIKPLLDHLGITVVRSEGENQYLCKCPVCGGDKLYVNKTTGLFDCKRNCISGNPFKLVKLMKQGCEDRDVFNLLEQYGLGTDAQSVAPKPTPPKKLQLRADQVREATDAELQQLCDVKGLSLDALRKFRPFASQTQPEILLPAFSPDNMNKASGVMRIRIDGQKIQTAHGEEKYPMVAGSSHGLLGVHWLAQANAQEIIFAEGWRDALAAIAAGFYATASSGGASCFKDEWLPFFKDKTVYICMDCDNAGVKAAIRAANKIWHIAKEVKIINLPYEITESHGKDLYDYLQEHSKDELLFLLQTAPVFVLSSDEPEPETDTNTLTEQGVSNGVVVLADDHPDTIAKTFRQHSIVCAVKHRYQPCDGWTMFKDSKYQQIDERTQLWRYISKFANRCYFQRGKKKERINLTTRKLSDAARQLSYLDDVYLLPKQTAPCCLDGKLDTNHIIALNNGLLDWSKYPYQLLAHTEQYYTLNYLPFDWNGEMDSELWIRFLIDVTGGNEELFDLLQQWAGYCLMKHNQNEQRFMIIYGEGGTGKSVFVDVLTHLLGRTNVAAIPLEKFDDPHYVIQTYGKMLNVTDESETRLEETIETHIKHYTGGTVYTFKRLYQEPFSAYPTAKIMIVTNHLPAFKDTSDGVWRRLLIAPFDNVIGEDKRIKGLAHQIIATEMPGVLKWALEGARKIEKFGFIIPKICQNAVNEYRREAVPEIAFFEENFETGDPENPEFKVRCDYVRNTYKQWCELQGCGTKSQKKLAKTMKKMFPLCERKRGREGLEVTYFYYGLKQIENGDFSEKGLY